MAFSSADLVKIETAIIALATNERVVKVSFDDGSSSEFAQAELPQLEKLRDKIAGEIAMASGTSKGSFLVATTSKGL